MNEEIKKLIMNSILCKENILNNEELIDKIKEVCGILINSYKKNKKVYIMGNGGSAADAQHFAAELVGRYLIERPALPAIAFTTDTSILTAIGNDYGFDVIFERQVEALVKEGDIVIGITTSGNSKNIILALEKAQEKGAITVGLLGKDGGKCKQICDCSIIIESDKTPNIQEAHIMIIHIICDIVERDLYAKKD